MEITRDLAFRRLLLFRTGARSIKTSIFLLILLFLLKRCIVSLLSVFVFLNLNFTRENISFGYWNHVADVTTRKWFPSISQTISISKTRRSFRPRSHLSHLSWFLDNERVSRNPASFATHRFSLYKLISDYVCICVCSRCRRRTRKTHFTQAATSQRTASGRQQTA